MRKKIVAGNWKMNTLPTEGASLAKEIVEKFDTKDVDLIIAPPFTHIGAISKVLINSQVKLSAQNMAKEDFGAFTGEISGEMLKSLDVEYVIIGHSERRSYYEETNSILFAKIRKALSVGLIPIYCVGENLEERESGNYFNVIKNQLEDGVFGLSKEDFSKLVIAYEPVWAIGTGRTASPVQAQEVHAFIRKMVGDKYELSTSENLSILYGGSCKPSNAKELFSKEDIDGGLIGGAALNANDFVEIAKSF